MDHKNTTPGWMSTAVANIIGRNVVDPSCVELSGAANLSGVKFFADVSGENSSIYMSAETAGMTQDEFKAQYPDLMVQLAVEYAADLRPVLQLEAGKISALSGINALRSNTGKTMVKGCADPVAVFRTMAEQIENLEAVALTVKSGV